MSTTRDPIITTVRRAEAPPLAPLPAFEKELDGISKQTMDDHFKLYEGDAKKANECRKPLNEFDYSEIEGTEAYSPLRAASIDYTFALLGFKNHDLYFGHLGR